MEIIQDIPIESRVVGMILRKPEILDEYIELIIPEDDFSENNLRFLYNLITSTYLKGDIINETSLNITISKMSETDQNKYKDMGGYGTLKRLASMSEVSDDFKKQYEQLKSYNVLRKLDNNGFAVRKFFDKLKDKNTDQILKAFELQLMKAGSCIKGINDSVVLGNSILDTYENLKESPSIGIQLPFRIVDSLVRGWATSTMFASALHSGFGKSRWIVFILAYLSIVKQTPVLFMVNEQEMIEIELMLLTCIANNVFSSKYGVLVDETEIALGKCTDIKDVMVREAAKYIKQNSKIHFLEIQDWSYESLRMILKKHKLRGIDYAVIDTFKSMKGTEMNSMPDWLQFSYTAEKLKKMIGSEAKGGLNMGLWVTMQMTDESLLTKVLGSSSIAFAKHVKHSLDYLQMSRMLDSKDKETIKVKIDNQIHPLDIHKIYYLTFIDKNRRGNDKRYIIYEVDKGKMIFKELGYAVFNDE
jgi:replicative DNA helicase